MKRTNMRIPLLLAVIGFTAVVGCAPSVKPPPPPPPAPTIAAFTSSAAEVESGAMVTLTWETKDAKSIRLHDSVKGVVSGIDDKVAQGNTSVVVGEDTLFVLTAENERGVRDTAALAVTARGGARKVSFVASPGRIQAGESVALAWLAEGAKQVLLKDSTGQSIDLEGQLGSGSVEVVPARDETYTLTVDGRPYTAQVRVTPTIGAFVATPSAVKPGASITLSWQTSGAASVKVQQEGVGLLHTESDAAKVTDGSFEVTSTATRPGDVLTFHLQAIGADPTAITFAHVEVYVAGAPAIRAWNVPPYAKIGGTFEVSWDTTGAEVVDVLKDGQVVYTSPSEDLARQGSTVLPTPATDATYVLRARGLRGGQALSVEKVVNPVGTPAVVSFTATPSTITDAGTAVTLDWTVTHARKLWIVANGDYFVTGATGVGAETGTRTAYPNETTVYTLTADNGLGELVTATAQVTVTNAGELNWTPAKAPIGAPIELAGVSYGPHDVMGLPWVNSGTVAFEDISKSGTPVGFNSADDESLVITLPETFTTTFFDFPVSTDKINVSLNGWFSLGPTPATGFPRPGTGGLAIELPPYAIAPYFDALRGFGAPVQVQLDEVNGEQRLIVQWTDVQHEDAIWGTSFTFQAQVYSSGRIAFAYDSLFADGFGGPHVGLVDPFGATALTWSGTPVEKDSLSWFEPMTPPVALAASPEPVTVRVALTGGFIQTRGTYPFIPPDQFVISEVHAFPAPGVVDGQWFELENRTSQPIPLDGWTIDTGAATHVITSATLPANGHLVFGQSATAGDGVTVDYVFGNALSLPSSGKSSLALTFANGTYTSLMNPPLPLVPGYSWQLGAANDPALTVIPGVTEIPCAARFGSTWGTHGQHGTPGAPNTVCPSYAAQQSIPEYFESLSGSGTSINFIPDWDEGSADVVLPFTLPLGHHEVTTLSVFSNGFLSLRPMSCDKSAPDCFSDAKDTLDLRTTPTGILAPFWDGLHPRQGGGAWWATRDPDNIPGNGNEYVIVSWENLTRSRDWPFYDDVMNFQVKLFVDGTIEYHYGFMVESHWGPVPQPGLTAASWFEDPTGLTAWMINSHSNFPGVPSNSALRFNLQ